jgi:predicted metal-dependent hydrolase
MLYKKAPTGAFLLLATCATIYSTMVWKLVRRRRRRASSVTKHYFEFKEDARAVVMAKLVYWNQFYNLTYKRVAIRNTRRSWGSCTSLKNLNFSYRLLFLPEPLQDYIIVHELCHLQELHHKESFWLLVAQQIPDYTERIKELKTLEKHATVT